MIPVPTTMPVPQCGHLPESDVRVLPKCLPVKNCSDPVRVIIAANRVITYPLWGSVNVCCYLLCRGEYRCVFLTTGQAPSSSCMRIMTGIPKTMGKAAVFTSTVRANSFASTDG